MSREAFSFCVKVGGIRCLRTIKYLHTRNLPADVGFIRMWKRLQKKISFRCWKKRCLSTWKMQTIWLP
nr:MAG TPA: hypothetical protein [Caudoviricetes sp.]